MASTMFHQLPSMETEHYDWSGANNDIRLLLVEYLLQYSSNRWTDYVAMINENEQEIEEWEWNEMKWNEMKWNETNSTVNN